MANNNVLVIPNADFSGASVENVFTALNTAEFEKCINVDWQAIAVWFLRDIHISALYQNRPIGKIRLASKGAKAKGNTSKVSIWKIDSGSDGETANVNLSSMRKLFDIITPNVTQDTVDLLFPEVVTFKSNEFFGIEFNDSLGNEHLSNFSYFEPHRFLGIRNNKTFLKDQSDSPYNPEYGPCVTIQFFEIS